MNPVDELYKKFSTVLNLDIVKNDLSLSSATNDTFKKFLLLAAASQFEARMTAAVLNFARQATAENHALVHLVERKAVKRQYHTWFQWDSQNANAFFAMFGSDFRKHMGELLKENDDLGNSIAAFMKIGRARNELVHENIATFAFDKTSEEVYDTYKQALLFVEWFPGELKKFAKTPAVYSKE